MNWSDYANKTRSTKIALAHLFPRQRWKEWTLVSGNVYSINPPFIIEDVYSDLTQLTRTTLPEPPLNQWCYDFVTNTLCINVGSPPKTQNIILTYRICLSSAPVVLPYDLNLGDEVDYEPRIKDISDIKLELDYEAAGIALETSSSVTLENTDGYFDDSFDTLIWENQRCLFYGYGLEIDPANSKLLFDGFIDSKTFDPKTVKFSLKDQFKRLRDRLSMPLFSTSDGIFDESYIDRPKRRIYGRVKNITCLGIDKVLDGFEITGSVTADVDSSTLNGVGTIFLDELTPEDEFIFTFQDRQFKYKIQSIESNTSLTMSQPAEFPLSGTPIVNPSVSYRKKNRRWHIAGHKLRTVDTTVTEFVTPTRLRLSSVADIMAGDRALYNGNEFVDIVRITGDVVVLDQAVVTVPVGGETFSVVALRDAFFKYNRLIEGRDYSFTNTASDAILELEDLAEFNITNPFKSTGSFTFTNGSRAVTCSTTGLDLGTILKPRDWVRADSITRPEWYEVLEVTQNALKIRTAFSTANFTGSIERKNIDLIADDSLITVDCNGMDSSGSWIKNASRAVKHVLQNDINGGSLNLQSFTDAESDAPQLISAFYPKSLGSEAPVIRDVITDLNKSVFGALYQDRNFAFTFSVLQSDKDDDMFKLQEDDVLSYSSATKPNIANVIRINYRPFTDVTTGSDAMLVEEFQNEFVDSLSQIKNTSEVSVNLYEQADAINYAQRLGFLRSLTNSNVQVKGKLNLQNLGLGQKVILEFDRLYKRYGGESTSKVGLVYSVQNDESGATIGVNDFNGMFTRVPAIAPNDADDYNLADRDEKSKWGYIVDNDTETPDSVTNMGLGNNLIG